METSTKFNVIVPTRERADTLIHCLRTLVAQEYDNFDIIVSDNFSQDGTKDMVASFSDRRIKYLNTGKRVSMTHNWEFALSHVTEGWVMILGDDDGLYPWALRTLNKRINEHKVEAVWSSFGSFLWPGHFEDCMRGVLSVPLTDSAKLKRSKTELERLFSGRSLDRGLPWLYAGGAASINLINRLRDANGRFFCSQVPDIYSAVALASATQNYLSVETPIALSGASKHSNGTAWVRTKTQEGGGPIPLLKPEGNIPFHDSLVSGKSFHLTWYEAYLQSWHIHQGALGITLSEQLKIALKAASPEDLKNIQEQCRTIAAKNGVPVPDPGRGWGFIVRRWIALVQRVLLDVQINPRQYNVANSYDAVVASADIYRFMRNWPLVGQLCLLIFNLKRAVVKLGSMAFRGRFADGTD
jgi:hypothetical protein